MAVYSSVFILRLTFVYSDILDLAKVLRISAIYTVPIAVVIIRNFQNGITKVSS